MSLRIKIDGRTKLGKSIRAGQMLTKCLYEPHFYRQFWCWSHMRRVEHPLSIWIEDVGYCLDRTEVSS